MRKLVRLEKIREINPIENADSIERARIQNWDVVVKKGEFSTGDVVVYCEIDSFLPALPVLGFLRKSSWRQHPISKTYGYYLKTIRLRGVYSQGLILPVSILQGYADLNTLELGEDLSDVLGVIKWEDAIPAQLAGKVIGFFPSFCPKTDEERIQNLVDDYAGLLELQKQGTKFYVTEKLDGTSFTCFTRQEVFGVCSRNLQLAETVDNVFWQIVKENRLQEKFLDLPDDLALQGEIIGPGIQKNRYGLSKPTLFCFTCIDLNTREKLSKNHFDLLTKEYFVVQAVPVLDEDFILPQTIDLLLHYAVGKSVLNDKTEREGVVIRSYDNSISFKVISNKYLAEK